MPVLVPIVLVVDMTEPEALDMAPVATVALLEVAEVAVLPPATAAPLAPDAVLAPVAASEAGQLAAEGSVTLTLDFWSAKHGPRRL